MNFLQRCRAHGAGENRTGFLKLFLAADADGWNTDGTAKDAKHAK